MQVIVRQGNGEYYVSAVFGYYKDIKSTDDYQRYLESIHSPYFVVWDKDKTRLIKVFAMRPDTIYIDPLVLIVSDKTDGWIINEDGTGGVDFLPRALADQLVASGELTSDLRERCNLVDQGFTHHPYQEIITEEDAENLLCVSGGFHDAVIDKLEMMDDGTLFVLFDGVWGCSIEMWFWGDVQYDTSSRNPNEVDPYWSCASVLIQDGYVFLVDDEDMEVSKITSNYCWFKARHVKYHVIPD